jgi:hypothetical protein
MNSRDKGKDGQSCAYLDVKPNGLTIQSRFEYGLARFQVPSKVQLAVLASGIKKQFDCRGGNRN